MLKKYSTLLGIGLLLLWATGVGSVDTTSWMTWLVGLGSLCAFGIAAFTPSYASRNTKMGEAVLLSTGLYCLWIASLVNGVVPWMSWWTFTFACAFLLLGIVVGLSPERRAPLGESILDTRFGSEEERLEREQERFEEEKERFRRGA